MKLTERNNCYTIDDFFGPSVIAGFTKPNLSGNPQKDIRAALAFLESDLAISYLKQVHSSLVCNVERGGLYTGDGLFTSQKSLALVVKTADCLPIFFAKRDSSMVGMVHMGWRGARADILGNIPVDSYKVIAGVGLRKCCYQVGEEFLGYPQFSPFVEKRQVKLYFDVIAFTKERLALGGVDENNFIDLKICSRCHDQNFFSNRRDATASRTLSFIIKN
ncbi:MAG: polyphenol oxidase family protein [Candidatus Omnitrophica bacterium]|nr:polyphenol oxidase family protein [Candidatus Omnitrophota bacterium]